MSGQDTETLADDLQNLLTVDIVAMPDGDALDHVGELIDLSRHTGSAAGLDRAFALLDVLELRDLGPEIGTLIHYFRGNAWAGREESRTGHNPWAWEQPEHQEQILALRSAVRHEGFARLSGYRHCQILTNLANELSHIGRVAEAIELWDRALRIDGKFGMALGNRAIALDAYARSLYDRGQAMFMFVAAHDALESAAVPNACYESAGWVSPPAEFEERRLEIAALGDIPALREQYKNHRHSIGKGKTDQRYRTWCLQSRLFINPLNDLGPLPVAAHDVLALPSITVPPDDAATEPPVIFGFFNQMKQEFASARYLYYEGIHAERTHFSDRDVLLYNTLDYPAYGLATEKIRLAFRAAYSLFDKIGYFINDYFALGIKPERVSFRNLWYEEKSKPPRPLLKRFTSYENWPLRGLFWLSKDLFDEAFKSATEPDAAQLNEIRNHLEHKYLQLHSEALFERSPPGIPARDLRYSLTADEFARKTLRLLKLARAALTYLSLAVHTEERLRAKARRGERLTLPLQLHVLPQDWKR